MTQTTGNPVPAEAFTLRSVLRTIAAGVLVGMASVVSAASFAAIIYTGELSAFLDRGIGLSILGGLVMSALGALMFQYRGTISHAQDTTAILLAAAAASIAVQGADLPPERLFATVSVMIMLAALLAGVASYGFGRLRLSLIVRYLPYPMLGGFLAATGYLLTLGGISVTLDKPVSLQTLSALWGPGALVHWLPWTLASGLTVIITRTRKGNTILPACVVAATVCFYAILALTGTSLSEAAAGGYLLGPFAASGPFDTLPPLLIGAADWGLILGQLPALLAVVAMTLLGATLNIQGLSHLVGSEPHYDKDLRAVGTGNVLSGLVGGLVGFPALGDSMLAYRLGLLGMVAGLSVAVFSGLILIVGLDVLGILPRGMLGMLLSVLGIDLLYTWLWKERRRLAARDVTIIVLILAIAAIFGFIPALALGFAASMLLFVMAYARFDPVRNQTTLASRRSMVERGDDDNSYLGQTGASVAILELSGFLFFGTATALRERISRTISQPGRDPQAVIIDFRRVPDIDASAIAALSRMIEECRAMGVAVVFTALKPVARMRIQRFLAGNDPEFHPELFETLDEALQALEMLLIANRPEDLPETDQPGFLEALAKALPDHDLSAVLLRETFEDGQEIFHQGDTSRDFFVLESGGAHAKLTSPAGSEMIVARYLPGALFGEMAFYTGAPRSASVLADGRATVLRLPAALLEGPEAAPPSVVAAIHRVAAHHISKRLARYTGLLHQALG